VAQTYAETMSEVRNAAVKLQRAVANGGVDPVSGYKDDVYGHYYLERKAIETEANEAGEYAAQAAQCAERVGRNTDAYKAYSQGKLPPAHIHSRAKRWAVKLFLAHWHWVAYECEHGAPPPKPYIIETDPRHTHIVKPPNWPMPH
jgi:hypothetical protein